MSVREVRGKNSSSTSLHEVIGEVHSHFFRDKITLEATGAHFYRKSGAVDFGFYLHQIGFPGSPGAVFSVAYLVAGCSMFSAEFTSPRHISFLKNYLFSRTISNFNDNVKPPACLHQLCRIQPSGENIGL